MPEDLSESEQEALERLLEMLLGENEPVIIRDLATDPRARPMEIRWTGSLIAVPIVHKGESVGVFALFGKRPMKANRVTRCNASIATNPMYDSDAGDGLLSYPGHDGKTAVSRIVTPHRIW